MAYQRKYLFGFWPFWPVYPVGYMLAVLFREIAPAMAGHSGRRYLRQHWQLLPTFTSRVPRPVRMFARRVWPAWRAVRIAMQLPGALVRALGDEILNIWQSRKNNRVVGQ